MKIFATFFTPYTCIAVVVIIIIIIIIIVVVIISDPYVKVEVTQSSHTVSKKQTTTKKKTSHPVYDETFTFNISPKMDELTFTSLTILIFDHDRIRSDDVIGRVVLGNSSTEASEFEHWTEILANPGHLITRWHYLVELDD